MNLPALPLIADTSKIGIKRSQIIKYVFEGLSNKEIADLLGVTEKTIKCHMTAILRQEKLNSRAKLVNRITKRKIAEVIFAVRESRQVSLYGLQQETIANLKKAFEI